MKKLNWKGETRKKKKLHRVHPWIMDISSGEVSCETKIQAKMHHTGYTLWKIIKLKEHLKD